MWEAQSPSVDAKGPPVTEVEDIPLEVARASAAVTASPQDSVAVEGATAAAGPPRDSVDVVRPQDSVDGARRRSVVVDAAAAPPSWAEDGAAPTPERAETPKTPPVASSPSTTSPPKATPI